MQQICLHIRQHLYFCIFTFSFFVSANSHAFAESAQLRILTYNIHHGQGNDGKFDLQRIADVILKTKPDFVALQELDQKTGRSKKVDQPAALAKLLNMDFVFAQNLVFDGGHYGVAAYSRFPVSKKVTHRLPQVEGPEPRGIAELIVETPGKQTVRFLSTHWCHKSAKDRLASAKLTNTLRNPNKDSLAIVTGDFNATPQSAELLELSNKWEATFKESYPTWPAEKPRVAIDHVYISPESGWKVKSIEVIQEKVASDHCPLLVVLERTK